MHKPIFSNSLSTIHEDMESSFASKRLFTQPSTPIEETGSSPTLQEIFAQPSASEYWNVPWLLSESALEHIKVEELYRIVRETQTNITAFATAARTLYQTHVICMASVPLSTYANNEWIAHYDICHALLALVMDAERRFVDLQRVLIRNGDELGNDLGIDNGWLLGLRAYLVVMKDLLVEKFKDDRFRMVLRFEKEQGINPSP
ncbi:MAG: hypothetical protein M1812_006877 [Candelaria pacifica]|nr:MAG: hypothetical protein M1812_006877 [Candelaria pacifica]